MPKKKARKKPSPVTLEKLLKDYTKGQPDRVAFVATVPVGIALRLKKIQKLSGASFNTTVNTLLAALLDS